MKTLIIDGHNTIHKIFSLKKELAGSHEAARDSLVNLVNSWRFKKNYSGKIYIVFDGQDNHWQQGRMKEAVSIIYSKTNESADSRIISMIKNIRDKASLTVVTCDEKDIGSFCRPLGIKVIKPDFLIRKAPLKDSGKENDKKLPYNAEKEINENLKKIWNIT